MTVIADAAVVDCRIEQVLVGGISYLAARFNVDVWTDGAIDLGASMDAIAAKVPVDLTGRVYAWPMEEVTPLCAIVGYPDDPINFDETFGRGSDRATFPLFVLVGKPTERTARDVLSAVLTGATGIKDAIDGPLSS